MYPTTKRTIVVGEFTLTADDYNVLVEKGDFSATYDCLMDTWEMMGNWLSDSSYLRLDESDIQLLSSPAVEAWVEYHYKHTVNVES